MPKTEAIAEQNVAEVPLYTSMDVARYLRVPVWVPLVLADPRFIHPKEFAERFWYRPGEIVHCEDDYGLTPRQEKLPRISFHSLVTLFVHSPLFRSSAFWPGPPYWNPKLAFHTFEIALDALQRIASEPGRFSDPDLLLSRFDLDSRHLHSKEKVRKLILLHIGRVEVNGEFPTKIFPFSRDPASVAPRVVEIDPEIRFGRPSVKGVPTDVIVERWRAGDTSADLADDYGLTTDEVDEAIRYESAPDPFGAFPPFGW